MGERLDLSKKFKMITPNVYFQPPESAKLTYPCIIYQLSRFHTTHADNGLYTAKRRYTVTAIDKNPDSNIPDLLLKYPLSSFDRYFVSDNLHHWVFGIYF